MPPSAAQTPGKNHRPRKKPRRSDPTSSPPSLSDGRLPQKAFQPQSLNRAKTPYPGFLRKIGPFRALQVVAYSSPSCGVSKGYDRPREDGQRWQVQPTDGAVGNAAAGPIVALAMAGRTQHRWREGSLVMAPTTQRT